MDKRSYNIFFDLHTVSGIVISVLLYVIFFAGSFSFFRGEIISWERNEPDGTSHTFSLDVDAALDTLQKSHNLLTRNITISQREGERRLSVYLSAPNDTLIGTDGAFFYINPDTYKTTQYETSYTLGEFLYRLHFFAQIPYPAGYYLSGFTALFFLFAVLTGILVHWKKIIPNFYLFRPWEKLKTVWTDAHTALGTIGLPFQVVYAVTGAFFMISILLVAPGAIVLYNGDQAKLYDDLGYGEPVYPYENKKLENLPSVNGLISKTSAEWEGIKISEVEIFNYGDSGMHVKATGELSHGTKFTSQGGLTFNVASGEIVQRIDPNHKTTYREGVVSALYHLHYGNYGGYPVKGISFLLGLVTCFVIITGILIWLDARNKKHIHEKEKRFNRWVGYVYLAICLTMFPVTAASFVLVALLPREVEPVQQTILYSFYFGTWLLLAVLFALRKDNYRTNKHTLMLGALLGICVPLTHGVVSGNWFWKSVAANRMDLFTVDLLWIILSVLAFWIACNVKRPVASERSEAEAFDEADKPVTKKQAPLRVTQSL